MHRLNTLNDFKISTVAYKGSKRKLVPNIIRYADEINAESIFDGFSGTGIVSAALRNGGYEVIASDMSDSSYIFGKVFLEGYDAKIVEHHVGKMNQISPTSGWLTENYSGTVLRKVRGTSGIHARPLGLTVANASKIDAARDYVESLSTLSQRNKNALIFSTIKACDSVFNNSNDQKSALKKWSKKSLKEVQFKAPTLVSGPAGTQLMGDIFNIEIPECDMAYLDPPYTHGVLYASCYHLSNSLALWDRPDLNKDYAVPRPGRAVFRTAAPGPFYSKKTIKGDFDNLLGRIKCKRILLSYSDAPRNCITIKQLVEICKSHGDVRVEYTNHKICTQYNTQEKRSDSLKEYFIIIDN
tara:strand:+ start:35 stop:1099 length:1065 start_codon:yes stop_codon:yes gene_type:complete